MILQNFSLKKYNTFGIDVSANFFGEFNSVTDLQEILMSASNQHLSTIILGEGSNMLFTKNFNGLILKNEIKGIDTVHEDEDHVYIKVGAGESWHRFVIHCISKNLAGAENLSLIPGNVGASPMQNIGAYGVELKDIFYSLEALHIRDNKLISFTLNDCEFAYRESVFKKKYKNEYAILTVTFRLNKKQHFNISYGAIEQELQRMNISKLSIQAISQAVINIRRSKLPDPKVIGNAGSFFKNPEITLTQFQKINNKFPAIIYYPLESGNIKLAAGWLIEQCGWKGRRKGDAGCHEKQALVLVNYGNASGKEIFELGEEIKKSVKKKFNIDLEREVNVI